MAGWTIEWPEQAPDPRRAAPALGTHASPLPAADLTLSGLLGRSEDVRANAEERRPAQRMARPQQADLARLVELEIMPRLMVLHRRAPWGPGAEPSGLALGDEQVQRLARLSVMGEADSAAAYVRELLAAGAVIQQVYLDLLAPCARWLGAMWEEDRCSFSQVTVGLWRLQRVLHEHASFAPGAAHVEPRRALFASVPLAQHTFGACMVADLFGRGGWEVDCMTHASWSDLQAAVAQTPLDLFGLSVSTSDSIPGLAAALGRLRRASANPHLFIMVGGPMAACTPDLAARCGADAMATDASQALAVADARLPVRARSLAA